MKRFGVTAFGVLMSLGVILGGCQNKETAKEGVSAAPKGKTAKTEIGVLPNYRYVDIDTVLSRYNLAKDYNEEMMRMQSDADSKMKKHENNLQSMASQMQKKQQNNGYLTQESFQQDQTRLQNAQVAAQKEMQQLQTKMEQAMESSQKAVRDSIDAFIKSYNASRGYEAIFYKGATLYIDERLDITDEVVEGLNARYNKKK